MHDLETIKRLNAEAEARIAANKLKESLRALVETIEIPPTSSATSKPGTRWAGRST